MRSMRTVAHRRCGFLIGATMKRKPGPVGRSKEEAIALLFRRVTLKGECFEWNMCRTKGGYPRVSFEGRQYYAHRLCFEAYVGEIPEGCFVCHRCDNPPCINPLHLFAGTPKDNITDMDDKGRRRNVNLRGSAHGSAKLHEDDVKCIRLLSSDYNMSYARIGALFGVGSTTVHYAVKYGWRHI